MRINRSGLLLGIPKVTSFSRMLISVAVNGTASSMDTVLNVGLYFEKMGFYSQCHISTLVCIHNKSSYIHEKLLSHIPSQ